MSKIIRKRQSSQASELNIGRQKARYKPLSLTQLLTIWAVAKYTIDVAMKTSEPSRGYLRSDNSLFPMPE